MPADFRWADDVHSMCDRIEQAGFYVSSDDMYHAWSDYSDDRCASWMENDRYTGEELVAMLSEYLEPMSGQ